MTRPLLLGSAVLAARTRALAIARGTDGVVQVVDQLAVVR